MQAASQAYQQVMKEKWRDLRTHLRVSIGVINQEAQAGAYVSEPGHYTYYSNLIRPLDNYEVTELYATCEQDYTPVDGSVYFLPRSKADIVLNQGIVTETLLGSIEVRFPYEMDINGLTVEFGKAYPINFQIESDHNRVEVTGNRDGHFVTEEIFESVTFLRFVPVVLANGVGRFRIHQLTMGIGIYFDGKKILTATKKEHISPIDEELPTIDFTATLENRDRLFDIENSKSVLNFLEVGQSIEILYGQELPDGTIEWLPGATLSLRGWSVDDEEMSFTASDRFEDLDGIYYGGLYRPDGISLYDLAVNVLADAGLDERDFWIDSYLRSVTVQNPIPPVTHKEALQLIANAGRCLLYQDREGKLFLRSGFVPEVTASSDDEAYFSHAEAVLDGMDKASYALVSEQYTDVIPTQAFLPRQTSGSAYLHTGYISDASALEDGTFLQNPVLETRAEAAFKCFGLTLEFGRNHPAELVIHTWRDGTPLEQYQVSELQETTVIHHEFPEFDRMALEFVRHQKKEEEGTDEPEVVYWADATGKLLTDGEGALLTVKGTASQAHSLLGTKGLRVTLNHMAFGEGTEYKLGYGVELLRTPKGTQLPKVQEIQVIRRLYETGSEVKELASGIVPGNGQYVFYFDSPCYGLSCGILEAQGNQSVAIVDQSSYSIKIEITNAPDGCSVAVYGREYSVDKAGMSRRLNPSGTRKTWENPLISQEGHAADLALWIGDYLAADREYDLKYRGEPRLDAGDVVYLENPYVPNLEVQLQDHTLVYHGALEGTIKARRIMRKGG